MYLKTITAFSALAVGLSQADPAASYDTWPWQTYKSSPAEPPNLNITKYGPTSPGYLFFDQSWSAHRYGVFIMSDDNELVWQSPYGDMKGFKAQILDGEPVLTFFNGLGIPEPYGWGYGIIQVLDASYRSIYNVSVEHDDYRALGGVDSSSFVSWLDIHEDRITGDGTMLVTGYNVTRADLSSVGGPARGWVADSLFYEIDVKTNEILFRWSALDHVDQIPLRDVQQFYPLRHWGRNDSFPYGYFHINSVEKVADGGYLISSRYYCSLFKIAADGLVEWTLQGQTGGDFTLDNINFCWQHDARIHRDTPSQLLISIFDNDNSDVKNNSNPTEGLFMNVDLTTMHVSRVLQLEDPHEALYAASQGNLQLLRNGHSMMGYGAIPKIKEYSANGSIVMSAQFGPPNVVSSYRAYRAPWKGTPYWAPSVYACVDRSRNQTEVYMSWNGATEVQGWSVEGGIGPRGSGHLRPVVGSWVRKTGFETKALVPGGLDWVRARAEGMGIEPGVSEVVEVVAC